MHGEAEGRVHPQATAVDLVLAELLDEPLPDVLGEVLGAVLVVGFLAFRLCDIAKPWPASWADKQVKGGFGTMLDDAFVGIWAGALMLGALWVVQRTA